MKKSDFAVLILAAGSSSRLGEAKQLLQYQDKTLIQISIEKALLLTDNVFVVLGAKAGLILENIFHYPIDIYTNPNYKNGLGDSISYGISCTKSFDKTLIMLCDQPFIPLNHLKNLLYKSNNTHKIVCSFYNKDIAVPAIFPKSYYSNLISLSGDRGAKSIIKKNQYESISLSNSFALDIDTKEDKTLLNREIGKY